MADVRHAKVKSSTTHPNARPTFRCLPDRVSGIPMALDSRPLAAERPIARLHDHENPNFLPIAQAQHHERGSYHLLSSSKRTWSRFSPITRNRIRAVLRHAAPTRDIPTRCQRQPISHSHPVSTTIHTGA